MTHTLADTLKTLLKKNHMTISQLERKTGLKPFTVRNIVRGLSLNPSATNLQAIAEVFGCTVPDLLQQSSTAPLLKSKEPIEIVEDLEFLEKTMQHVLRMLKTRQTPLQFQQILLIVQESYTYSLKLNPPHVDEAFITWAIEKILA